MGNIRPFPLSSPPWPHLRYRAVTHVMLPQLLQVTSALVHRHEGIFAVAQAPRAFIQFLVFHSNQVHPLGQTASVSPHFGFAVPSIRGLKGTKKHLSPWASLTWPSLSPARVRYIRMRRGNVQKKKKTNKKKKVTKKKWRRKKDYKKSVTKKCYKKSVTKKRIKGSMSSFPCPCNTSCTCPFKMCPSVRVPHPRGDSCADVHQVSE